jgi:putative RecB family exonuclease
MAARKLDDLRRTPHWSFSSLNSFLNICSLRWAFEKVYKAEPERAAASLPFGRAFHAAASHFALCKMKGSALKLEELRDAFSEWLKLELSATEKLRFDEGESFASLDAQGRSMLKTFVDSWREEQTVLGVSAAYCVPIRDAAGQLVSELPLIGETDLELIEGGERVVVDWKTSARCWPDNKAGKDLQPTCLLYMKQVAEGERGKWLFRFDVVTKAKTPSIESYYAIRGRDDFARLAALVAAVERAVEAEAFLPNEGCHFCGSCAYACSCKAWHRNSRRITLSLTAA